ncbi:MAG: binding domain protein, partial [Acidimicrobiales bacterium]|nr:binding domain protein [Acidimicrobiales bacterium]
FLGEHARLKDIPAADRATPYARPAVRPRPVPVDFPDLALSRAPVRLFNQLYYRAHRPGDALVPLDPYIYPLDALSDWNRIYGRRGLVQYQCVLPLETSAQGLRRLLETIAREGDPSFLAVLKRMGEESFGLLSFPRPGYTLALDFPASPDSLALLARLDLITAEHGGRLYLAKDARMSPAMAANGYPRLEQFRDVRRRHGLTGHFRSLQSERLEL